MKLMRLGQVGAERPVVRLDETTYVDVSDVVDDFDTANFTPSEVAAGGSLLHYVKHQLLGSRTRLQAPVRHHTDDHMSIDKNSLRALEIRSTIRDGLYEGSLLHSLKMTVTKSGTRLLSQRLCEHASSSLFYSANNQQPPPRCHYQQSMTDWTWLRR